MSKLIGRAEEHLAGLLLAAVTFLIVTQLVLARLAPRLASPLTTLILALFFWTTMLAVPAATRRGAHLSVMFVRGRLPVCWQRILDITGRVVQALIDRDIPSGLYNFSWTPARSRARGATSGIYYLSLDAGATRVVRKFLIIQ